MNTEGTKAVDQPPAYPNEKLPAYDAVCPTSVLAISNTSATTTAATTTTCSPHNSTSNVAPLPTTRASTASQPGPSRPLQGASYNQPRIQRQAHSTLKQENDSFGKFLVVVMFFVMIFTFGLGLVAFCFAYMAYDTNNSSRKKYYRKRLFNSIIILVFVSVLVIAAITGGILVGLFVDTDDTQ
ncbi:uncharacterized protein [Dysidea avara]|uniref:uncharacterized protein n=1 Tax=Dysidea avara TaxID=196820 RepID=UPI00331AA0F8